MGSEVKRGGELTPLPERALGQVRGSRAAPAPWMYGVGAMVWVLSGAGLDVLLGTPLALLVVSLQALLALAVLLVRWHHRQRTALKM